MWLRLEFESHLDLTPVHLRDIFTESRQKDNMHVILGRLSFGSLGVTFS